jgi:putative transposase
VFKGDHKEMPYRINKSFKDSYYHVYNRGNNYEDIFFEQRNYSFFLSKITLIFKNDVDLICYCLMPNHYHLIVKVNDNFLLEKAMQRFSNSYTKALNKSINRVGHIFQGRYKSKPITKNDYLLHLSRYIHLNPTRKNLVKEPGEWKFSSYLDYVGLRYNCNLKMDIVLDQFKTSKDYIRFVKDYQKDQYYYIKDFLFR